ncbi:MAG: T9SS type A sorting domain-containing protein [Crocinitomix sp.]|nr:T9SS type A sorting domain-containing protein [Crocinitomix sp.]
MRYILLSIIAFSFTSSFGQHNGTEMFDESFVHEIRISFEQEDYWDSLEYYYEQYLDFDAPKQYMVASVEIDGTVIDSVGVREKGYFSNWGSEGLKEPLKIDFNEYVTGTKYDGLKKINLQNGFSDPTLMRDALAYKFMRDAGIAAPRSSYAKVYLNDTYWGLYVVVEQVDDRFVKNWFENENGNLYKCIDNTSLDWQGSSKVNYQDEFGLKTNEVADNWDDFIHLVDKIREDDEFDDSISTALQMNNYLRVLAADVLMYNWDSYYDHGRNFYMYYDSLAGAFQWIPWDYNLAFSTTETNIVVDYDGWMAEPKPLVLNVMESEIYREQYFNHLCVLIDNYFSLENLGTYIDETKALISEAVNEDPNKYYTTTQFNSNINTDITVLDGWGFETVIPGLKSFINARYATVTSQLESYSHACTALSVEEEVLTQTITHNVFPNPSNTGLFNIVFGETVDQITVYNSYGQIIQTRIVSELKSTELDLSQQARGLYILDFVGESRTQMRVIVQ